MIALLCWTDWNYFIVRIWGNKFQNGADSPPWDFPLDTIPRDQNISSPPATELSAIEHYPSLHVGKQRERRFSPVGIACGIVGVALVVSCAAIIIAIHIKRSRVHDSQDLKGDRTVLPINTKHGRSFHQFSDVHLIIMYFLSMKLFRGDVENMNFRGKSGKQFCTFLLISYNIWYTEFCDQIFNLFSGVSFSNSYITNELWA